VVFTGLENCKNLKGLFWEDEIWVRGDFSKKTFLRDEYSSINGLDRIRFGIVNTSHFPGADDRLILLISDPIPVRFNAYKIGGSSGIGSEDPCQGDFIRPSCCCSLPDFIIPVERSTAFRFNGGNISGR
jgi:hypothetical protein